MKPNMHDQSGPKVINLFSYSTEHEIYPDHVKMPTMVGILTFISRINTTSECFKQEKNVFFIVLLSINN